MDFRGNDFDVTAQFNTTDPQVVNDEVDRIYLELYPYAQTKLLDHAFRDLTRLYRGEYPGYHPCDTAYHDVQHVLDVTLAMARLIDGYERSRIGTQSFGDALFRLGVITALFHDMGYVRALDDHEHKNGAEYTLTHVSRGSVFLRDYLPKIGMAEMADIAAELIHFTGYEIPVGKIKVPSPIDRLLGSMLGSADIIAQMADRCYLEKCRDRLFPEFVAGGLATKRNAEGVEQVVFASGEDLVIKTPLFFQGASKRLDLELGGCYSFAQQHFGGQNLYLDEVKKNIQFAQDISGETDLSVLKRIPPETLKLES
jgi:hypothetical protein